MIATIELDKLNRKLNKIGKDLVIKTNEVPEGITKELARGAIEIRNTILTSMQKEKKTGRYYRKSKGVIHQASAPGEPPAVDRGELLRSIMFDVRELEVEIGSAGGAPYAKWLEFGTPKMKPRPFIAPAVQKHEKEIVDSVGEGVFQILKGPFERGTK